MKHEFIRVHDLNATEAETLSDVYESLVRKISRLETTRKRLLQEGERHVEFYGQSELAKVEFRLARYQYQAEKVHESMMTKEVTV